MSGNQEISTRIEATADQPQCRPLSENRDHRDADPGEREIRAREEAERVIRMHVVPELRGQPFGEPDRRPGESDASHARRKRTIDALFGR